MTDKYSGKLGQRVSRINDGINAAIGVVERGGKRKEVKKNGKKRTGKDVGRKSIDDVGEKQLGDKGKGKPTA